ncbi:alcohol dehydrogenase, iron-dependent domain protein, partial [Bordetella bronchiseptica E014]|uniref:iron-containing alcohol dehydrogenase n=1 Tax=Bordetella bronchiseptica TaxID=518 RepID=UPI00049F1122
MNALTSDMGWSDARTIVVRGHDLNHEIIGHLNLGDFAFLEITGRKPDPQESALFNALLAVLVEHGMTPTAMVARLTYLGAPESMQAAIAAGLCGMGTKFVGTAEGAARLLQEALPLVQVPTTAGTGSEATPIAIVTREDASKAGIVSPVLYCDIAVLDAALTRGLPPAVTAATGIDAIVHAVEAYTSRLRKNPISDGLAREAL